MLCLRFFRFSLGSARPGILGGVRGIRRSVAISRITLAIRVVHTEAREGVGRAEGALLAVLQAPVRRLLGSARLGWLGSGDGRGAGARTNLRCVCVYVGVYVCRCLRRVLRLRFRHDAYTCDA